MNRTAFVMSLGFGVLALTAQHAFSQGRTTCVPRPEALKQLAETWGETRRSIMLSRGSNVFEVYAADETGTWTILRTTPDGVSCIIESGTAFEAARPPEGAPV